MMKLNETTLPFLEVDCIQQFGQEKGKLIFEQAEKIYQELLNNADYRNNAAIQNHLQLKLFPTLAYYKELRGEGINQNEALEYVRNETHKAANVQKEEMKKLGSMPFAYTIYRLGVKKHMRKNFPDDGWTTEWVKCNGKEIHFNLHNCIYWELTKTNWHIRKWFAILRFSFSKSEVKPMIKNYLSHFLPVLLALDLIIPFLLAPFYKDYNHLTQVMSVLGNSKAPLHSIYNIWLVAFGVAILISTLQLYPTVAQVSSSISIMFFPSL
mgnify:CR=1 FL=1